MEKPSANKKLPNVWPDKSVQELEREVKRLQKTAKKIAAGE